MTHEHRRSGRRHAKPPDIQSRSDDWTEMWGYLAGSTEMHRFRELTRGLGSSQCLLCFGFADDVRHYMPKWMTDADEATIAIYEDAKWKQPLSDSETSSSLEDHDTEIPSSLRSAIDPM